MKKADVISGIVLLVLSGFVLYQSWLMPESKTFGPGPAFLPAWLGVFLAGLATILMIGALRRSKSTEEKNPFPLGKSMLAVGKVLGGLAVFALLMETVGFIVNTFVFVLYLMRATQRERWPMAALIAVLTTAGLYTVFRVILNISLPTNIYGF
jgi:putative tricarboxylic transport membrane protein